MIYPKMLLPFVCGDVERISNMPISEAVDARHIFYRLGDSDVFQYANSNTNVNGLKLVDVLL